MEMAEKKDKERHYQSLQAADLLAKYATETAAERGWPYSQAARYVRMRHPDLAELEHKGYTDKTESHHYEFSSHEAASLIAEKAESLMKAKKGLSYDEACKKVFRDPANAEICRCYAAAD